MNFTLICKSAIEQLNDFGFDTASISNKTGLSCQEIETLSLCEDDLLQSSDWSMKKLKISFVKESLKRAYRKNPFLGRSNVHKKLGLPQAIVQDCYDDLVACGELEFEMIESPEWVTDKSVKKIRQHKVK